MNSESRSARGISRSKLCHSAILLGVLIALLGCGFETVSEEVSYVVYGGDRYAGGPANGYAIEAADLEAIGTASEVHAGVAGADVFRLAGVDPDAVIIMLGRPGENSPYWILFRRGVLPDGGDQPPLAGIAHLCDYVVAREGLCD